MSRVHTARIEKLGHALALTFEELLQFLALRSNDFVRQ